MSEGALHPVQEEMLRIEAAFELPGNPPGPALDECIRQLIGFDGEISELDLILDAEVKRAVRLVNGHYREFVNVTAKSVAAIGFLQGVTFAAAARNLPPGEGQATGETVTVTFTREQAVGVIERHLFGRGVDQRTDQWARGAIAHLLEECKRQGMGLPDPRAGRPASSQDQSSTAPDLQ